MTSVTLKTRYRTPGKNKVFALPWCSYVPNLVRIRQLFLEILSENHLSHGVSLNDLCDLEIEVKVTRVKLDLCLALVLICTNLVKIRQIFLEILSENHLAYAHPRVQRDNIIRPVFQTCV